MKHQFRQRRRMLQILSAGAFTAAAGIGTRTARAQAAALVPLTSADPTAAALHYTEDASSVNRAANPAYMPGQHCAVCAQYQGKPGDARGGCNIYPGKSVSMNGWCAAFAMKPAAQ